MLVEAAQQPAHRDPRMPVRFLPCDQSRQLERLDETYVSEGFHRLNGVYTQAFNRRYGRKGICSATDSGLD